MSAQELDHSSSALDAGPDALTKSNPRTPRSRFNLRIVGIGLIVLLFLGFGAVAVVQAPDTWMVVYLAGLIAGLTLGTVFGLWIARWLGNALNLRRVFFASGIVVLSACVGFFSFPFLTTDSLWPRDPQTLFWSIGTASTLVSGTILCLVNFFWHSRDQQRIHSLRTVVNKNRATIASSEAKRAEAQARADDAVHLAEQLRRRAEEAERQRDEERTKADQAQREALQARSIAEEAQRQAQIAQKIAEKEKRWRSNMNLLLGCWQCIEYATRERTADPEMGLAIEKEPAQNKDILFFGADGCFYIDHPGSRVGFLDKIKSQLGAESQDVVDLPARKNGRWTLSEEGDIVRVRLEDGTHMTLKLLALKKTTMTLDCNYDEFELFRFLIKRE